MAGGAFLITVAAACALTDAQTVDLADTEVRLADVASLDCVASSRRTEMGQLAVASVDRQRQVTRAALAALVRRRIPALAGVDLGGAPDDAIRLRPPRVQSAPVTVECYVARRPIEAGAPISAEAVQRAPCAATNSSRVRVRYDRTHSVMRATETIAAGDPLGRMMAPPASIAEPGELLTLRIGVGNVMIDRSVEAVQASRGGAVFVRDLDGNVFSTPIAAEEGP